ncbi:MAG TPA: hypothetical protein VKJ47_08360 [Candidatus Binatia bacterium]|nr:hypothetical protein [Candidatus Binatia bacterium]
MTLFSRFKSFPVEADDHLYAVLRYVERNALRANLVARAASWRWGSLWRRQQAAPKVAIALHAWPVAMPADWVERVNAPQTEAELQALRRAVARNSPFGSPAWSTETARRLGLEATLRPRGRPPKPPADGIPTLFDLGSPRGEP